MKHAIVWYSHPQKFIFFEASATFSQRSPRFFPRGLCRGSPHGVPVLTEEGSQGWPNRLHHAQVGAGHPPPQADWQPAAFLRIRWKSQPPKKHVFRKRLHPWRGVDSMHGNGIDNIYIYIYKYSMCFGRDSCWMLLKLHFSNFFKHVKKKRSPLLQQKNSLCNEGKVNNEDALESICKDLKRYTPEV